VESPELGLSVQEVLVDFIIYDLADLLLKLLDSGTREVYEPCAVSAANYVITEWSDRKAQVKFAQDAIESRSEEAFRSLADSILGLSEPDVLSDAFSLAADFFDESPTPPDMPPPLDTNPYEPLPFHRLGNYRAFEHLCYDWVGGLMQECEVFLYGRPRQEQKGVDIVAFGAHKSKQDSRNAYFQCKLYKSFGKGHLIKAIKKFEENVLIHKARSFIIITGCDCSDTNVLIEFEEQKRRLKEEYRVNLVLLDALRLTTYLGQNRRDLIHKYFGKAYDRPYLSVPQNAEDLGEQLYATSADEIFPADLYISGGSGCLTVKNENVNVQIDLPDHYSHGPLCGAITLRMLNHMQIGLGSEDIHDLFSEVRVPLDKRPFIRGVIDEHQATTTMMISGCRVYPTVRIATSFADVIDACHDALLDRLRTYDRRFETEGFQEVRARYGMSSNVNYRIAAIDPMVWGCVRDAITDSTWDLGLNEAVGMLGDQRLHVVTGEKQFGDHRTDFYVYDDGHWPRSLSVMWEPPPGHFLERTNHWGAETAGRWFIDKLIPAAIKHREMRADRAWQRRPRWYAPFRKMEWVVIPRHDLRLDKAVYLQRLLDRADTVNELLIAVDCLQIYLDGEHRTWDANHRRRITTVLLIALRRAALHDHNLRYITTNIYNAVTDCTQEELIQRLESGLARSTVLQSVEGAYYLRAVGEMLQKTECPLSEVEVREMAELLSPFARVHDDKLRLKLHTPPARS
jgi:hypothetical protein